MPICTGPHWALKGTRARCGTCGGRGTPRTPPCWRTAAARWRRWQWRRTDPAHRPPQTEQKPCRHRGAAPSATPQQAVLRAGASHVQRFVKALAQHAAEGERAAQIQDIALDGTALCKACNGLVDHSLINAGSNVLGAGTLIDQGLHVALNQTRRSGTQWCRCAVRSLLPCSSRRHPFSAGWPSGR